MLVFNITLFLLLLLNLRFHIFIGELVIYIVLTKLYTQKNIISIIKMSYDKAWYEQQKDIEGSFIKTYNDIMINLVLNVVI